MIDTKKCFICKDGKKNSCLHWHVDAEDGSIWVYCVGKCQRGYSLRSYCYHSGLSLPEFLKGDFDFKEAPPNELQVQEWPARYIPLSDTRAEAGVDYIKSRGLTPEGDIYYDIERKGIVFPLYFDNQFVGAQTRFIEPRVHPDGEVQKMDTLPGTRLGLLVYGWNQQRFIGNVKTIVVCEGAFNALSINQAFNLAAGGISRNTWRAIACGGSGATKHHQEILKELKDQGLKIIIAPDSDDAGMNMLKKFKDAGVATHYALTGQTEDWNDCLKAMGREAFATFFLSRVKKIHD